MRWPKVRPRPSPLPPRSSPLFPPGSTLDPSHSIRITQVPVTKVPLAPFPTAKTAVRGPRSKFNVPSTASFHPPNANVPDTLRGPLQVPDT